MVPFSQAPDIKYQSKISYVSKPSFYPSSTVNPIMICTYWEDHGHESINRHEDESVNTDVRCSVDQILYSLTPDQTEGPSVENVVRGGGRYA